MQVVTFKDQVSSDLPTFINVDEFADTVLIDGVEVACVLEGNGDTQGSADGSINSDTIIRARASDFDKTPAVGQRLNIDDRQADVIAVSEDQGILIIQTRWWDS